MLDLFLSPHHDDEALFGTYTLLRRCPFVVVAIDPPTGYGPRATREAETAAAMDLLGLSWTQLHLDGDDPKWDVLRAYLEAAKRVGYQRVFAPAPEPGGQHQHNMVGEIAGSVFGAGVTHYLTYTSGGKSTWGVRVAEEDGWAEIKRRVLDCYPSQRDDARTAPHFTRGLEEYVAG